MTSTIRETHNEVSSVSRFRYGTLDKNDRPEDSGKVVLLAVGEEERVLVNAARAPHLETPGTKKLAEEGQNWYQSDFEPGPQRWRC